MIWGAVIAAAGRGVRFGRPKQLLEIAGKPMLAWSIEAFAVMPEVEELVIATEAEHVAEIEALARRHAPGMRTAVVVGGADRQASVARGLAALGDRCGGALVHDGARPLVAPSDVRRAMAEVREGTGALLAVPCVDTIKVVDGSGKVDRTLDRATLWAAQTPQLATLADMRRAFAAAERTQTRATDEASLLEHIGLTVYVVEPANENFKVTYPADLERADAILRVRGSLAETG